MMRDPPMDHGFAVQRIQSLQNTLHQPLDDGCIDQLPIDAALAQPVDQRAPSVFGRHDEQRVGKTMGVVDAREPRVGQKLRQVNIVAYFLRGVLLRIGERQTCRLGGASPVAAAAADSWETRDARRLDRRGQRVHSNK